MRSFFSFFSTAVLSLATSIALAQNAPSNLTGSGTDDVPLTITLNWSDNSNDETGFEIHRSTTPGGPYTIVDTAAVNAQTYDDMSIAANTWHYYVIRAIKSGSESNFTSEVAVLSMPNSGEIGDWIFTPKGTNWNTDSYIPYIYKGMQFRLKFPVGHDTSSPDTEYPIAMFFHGVGETGNENGFQLRHGGLQYRDAVDNGTFPGFAIFPQIEDGEDWFVATVGEAIEIVDALVAHSDFKVDPNRLMISGLSSGGEGVWRSLRNFPDKVAAAIPISAATGSTANDIPNFVHIPIWNSQGGLDSSPTPTTSTNLFNAIIAAGGNMRYTLYPTLGHNTWNAMFSEPDYFPFLARYSKVSVHVYFGVTDFCLGEPFSVTLGLTGGFAAYEWRRRDDAGSAWQTIAGATSNEIVVTDINLGYGEYAARFSRVANPTADDWTEWSDEFSGAPVVIGARAPSPTPTISTGLQTVNLPGLDGSNTVTLFADSDKALYSWSNGIEGAGDSSIVVSTAGQYSLSVRDLGGGCPSAFSDPVTVTVGNGPGVPAAPDNVTATTINATDIAISWRDNSNDENAFEIYHATNRGDLTHWWVLLIRMRLHLPMPA